MMSYWLALRAPDLVAAIAPVSGTSPETPRSDSPPVAVMHIHSVDDPRALYAGGLGPPFPLTTHRVQHAPVERVVQSWAQHDGCSDRPSLGPKLVGKEGSDDAGNSATLLSWEPCRSGYSVALWKLTGSGHVWPGPPRRYSEKMLGKATQVLSANDVMWRFFQRFSRPDAAPLATTNDGPRASARVIRLEDLPDGELDVPFDRSRVSLGVSRALPGIDSQGQDRYADVGYELAAGISLYSHLSIGVEKVTGLRIMGHARFGGLRAEMLGIEPRLYRAALGASGVYLSPGHNIYALYAGASVAEEIGAPGTPAVRPAVFGLGSERFGEDFALLYGGGVVYVLGKPFPLPLLGFTWRLGEDWRLATLLPVGLSLRWQASENWRLATLVTLMGESYRVKNDGVVAGGGEDAFVGVIKGKVGFRGQYELSSHWSFAADLGVETLRLLRVSDGSSVQDPIRAKPGGYLGASVAYTFGDAPF